MCYINTRMVSSGPHKLAVRLLLYGGCHQVELFYSRGAKQLACGLSTVLLGSSSAERNPAIYLPDLGDFERAERAPRNPPGTQTCAVVYSRNPCVPRSRGREKRPTGAGEKRANLPLQKKHIGTYVTSHICWYVASCLSFSYRVVVFVVVFACRF